MGYNFEEDEEEESSIEFKAFLMTLLKFVESANSKEDVVDHIKALINETEK